MRDARRCDQPLEPNLADPARILRESAYAIASVSSRLREGIGFALCVAASATRCCAVTSPTRKEMVMSRTIAALVMMGISLAAGSAYAQDSNTEPAAVEVTFMPAGAAYFSAKGDNPSFGNYGYGAAVAFNLNRFVGIEGEFGSMIATTSDLQFGDLSGDIKAPNMLSYAANIVLSVPTGHSVVPYATGGVGGLTMFERPALGVTSDETFLSGNVGGGVKWYAPNKRWGLRGDYRLAMTRSKDDAPEFFGRETRYAHRVYGGVIINTSR
jgi:opacity protein-like surface antigen